MKRKISEITRCPIRNTMELVGGKWTFSIVYVLMHEGTKRFAELEKRIEGINTRMLIKDLKMLEQNGIVERKVYPEVPPRVEYSITEKGRDLKNAVEELKLWGKKHILPFQV